MLSRYLVLSRAKILQSVHRSVWEGKVEWGWGICGPQQQQEDCDRMGRGVAGSERDVDEVRKEGGKTVLEKVFQRKVAMPKNKKKKHHVTCLETFSALVSVLSCCFPYLFGRRQKQSFALPFFHLIINETNFDPFYPSRV